MSSPFTLQQLRAITLWHLVRDGQVIDDIRGEKPPETSLGEWVKQ